MIEDRLGHFEEDRSYNMRDMGDTHVLFIAFHCLDSLDLLRNEHRRGIGRFAAINEKSTITFQLNRLNI